MLEREHQGESGEEAQEGEWWEAREAILPWLGATVVVPEKSMVWILAFDVSLEKYDDRAMTAWAVWRASLIPHLNVWNRLRRDVYAYSASISKIRHHRCNCGCHAALRVGISVMEGFLGKTAVEGT